jgi:hypothetical protein
MLKSGSLTPRLRAGGAVTDNRHMVQIVENVHAGEAESTRRVLPLDFPNRAAAVEHIEILQAQFAHRGWNGEQDYWWARDDGAIEVYRWWIED